MTRSWSAPARRASDDPLMTVRLPGMEDEKRLRVVLDTRLSLSPRSRFGATAREAPTLRDRRSAT